MVRRMQHAGEEWVNVNDLRDAMNSDELVFKGAAMLKAALDKGDNGLDAIRKCIAYFFTEATGALSHLEN
jgi:hypothetical protein